MPRVLPWKRRGQQVFGSADSPRSSPVPRVKQEDTRRDRDGEHSPSSSHAETPVRKASKRPRRSTSASPQPGPLQENFMIDGIDGDDRYRMVEDEFLATAHQFTAHLHAAEYKRLKATSELENAQTIRNISRPVVGQKTDLVKMKEERKSLAEKQRLATRKLYKGNASGDESTDDEDKNDSWQRQSLHGLMESPGKRAKHLGGLPSATSVTRAAAGFNRQSTVVSPRRPKLKPLQLSGHNLTYHQRRGSGNDLETSTGYRIAHRSPPLVTTAPRAEAPRISGVSKLQFGNSGKTTEDPRSVTPIVAEKTATADDDDLDIMARLKKRQEERRRNREQRRSTTHGSDVKSNLDDILPGFL